ncbi:hypothetical protein IscW_ISCW021737 [Ixodes scapularis]|uniref:Uncharacterized protein n=1 Tax=Ixodes scapularis TaxID=6945 RepID=B7Q7V4_IXOSC|nr:hypothetical protein IscW_ISCW021737 [Ixodes scapularis]|eukprot:XP_002412219.1 hypothetical protein IscW_ISCW021737 [Ixodes scapularis]
MVRCFWFCEAALEVNMSPLHTKILPRRTFVSFTSEARNLGSQARAITSSRSQGIAIKRPNTTARGTRLRRVRLASHPYDKSAPEVPTNDATEAEVLHVVILAVGRTNANDKLRVAQPNASVAVVTASQLLVVQASVDCHIGERPAAEPGIFHIHPSCWDATRIATGDSVTFL